MRNFGADGRGGYRCTKLKDLDQPAVYVKGKRAVYGSGFEFTSMATARHVPPSVRQVEVRKSSRGAIPPYEVRAIWSVLVNDKIVRKA